MSKHLPEEHRPDDEPTAELPALPEEWFTRAREAPDELADDELRIENARFVLIDAEAAERADGVLGGDSPDATTVVLEEDWSDLEHERRQREAELVALQQALADAREEGRRQQRARQELAARLATQGAQLADLLQQLRAARSRGAELEARLAAQQQHAAKLQAALERTRRQLARWRELALSPTAGTASGRPIGTQVSVKLRQWWQDMRARLLPPRTTAIQRVLSPSLRGATKPHNRRAAND